MRLPYVAAASGICDVGIGGSEFLIRSADALTRQIVLANIVQAVLRCFHLWCFQVCLRRKAIGKYLGYGVNFHSPQFLGCIISSATASSTMPVC